MARGRKAGKRTNRVIKLSIPKRLYYILTGIAGNNEQKLNRLIRLIIEEKLSKSTLLELTELIDSSRKQEREKTELSGSQYLKDYTDSLLSFLPDEDK